MKKKVRSESAASQRSRLKWRYCLWFYKTLKEAFDRIERKHTQLEIDHKLFKYLEQREAAADAARWQQLVDEFKHYIANKESTAQKEKYGDSHTTPTTEYLFLKHKLRSLERVIVDTFGHKELRRMQELYEQEMVQRIITEREHR